MDGMDVVESLRRFLSEDLRISNADTLEPGAALVRDGVIDSIELMQMVEFLEKTYGITVDETEIVPSNFRSMETMAGFVKRKRG